MFKSFLFKEPMVLFLLLAMTIFAYDALVSDPYQDDEKLVVNQGNIRHLMAGFEKTWQRPPTNEELQRLVDEYVREEIYYRQAMALGLDEGDTIVRRRLRQKYEFLLEDLGDDEVPDDQMLKDFMLANPDMFKLDGRLAFRQIYLDSNNPRNDTAYITSLKHQLQSGKFTHDEVLELSDSFMLQFEYPLREARSVDNNFGNGFAARLAALPTGSWQGPIQSGYGLHLVFLEHNISAQKPTLEQVRSKVLLEWQRHKKQLFLDKNYAALLGKYKLVIDREYLDSELPQ